MRSLTRLNQRVTELEIDRQIRKTTSTTRGEGWGERRVFPGRRMSEEVANLKTICALWN